MHNQDVFGDEELIAIFTCRGCPPIGKLGEVVALLVAFLGMTPDGGPVIKRYPKEDGKGGVGEMVMQPFVESGILANSYTNVGKTRFIIECCEPFDPIAVASLLSKEVGPVIRKYDGIF